VRAVPGSIASTAACVALLSGCAPLSPLPSSQSARQVAVVPDGATPAGGAGSPATGATGKAANAPPPEPLSPFTDDAVIFTVAGLHFTRGERVIVTVCLGPNHTIASADVFESSGDSKFDALAVNWARRIRLRTAEKGEDVATCGTVRVEVRPSEEPRILHAPGDALS
jgi:outer membrane biosynthesis protein TonB